MMKFVFAFVALLHLCYSVTSTMEVNTEIIDKLEELNTSYRQRKVSIPPLDMMLVPSKTMMENPISCVGVFVRELKQILNNVTVVEDSKRILTELRANLDLLGPYVEDDQACNMTERSKAVSRMPFKPYANFLRNLNRSKKR